MRITVATAVACLLAGMSIADEAHSAIKQDTTIPAQGLGSALKQLANERDIQLVYRSEIVGERQTSGAVGELTFDQALTKLLKGTGLTYQYLDHRAVTIVPMDSRSSSSPQAAGHRPQASSEAGVWERFRLAQAEQRPSGSSKDVPPPRLGIEEVIVTAQKRGEQRLLDVPLSVSVLTADEIDKRGLLSSEDYLRGIPGVNQTPSFGADQTIIIRGIDTPGSADNLNGAGSTVGTYFGETSTASSAGLAIAPATSIDTKLVDVERVEVLRGPQGTAFGSASLSGAVRIIPVAPKVDRLEGGVRAGYSSTAGFGGDNYQAQAVGNFPLIKGKLALRAVGGRYEHSGYYRNVAGSDPAFQASAAGRGAQAFAIDEDDIGASATTAGRVAALFQATDALRITLSYLKQRIETDGWGRATHAGYEQTAMQVSPEHHSRGLTGNFFDNDIGLANALVEYDLGWADLLGTYSNIKSWSKGVFGSLGNVGLEGGVLPFSFGWMSQHREHSGEVRLATRFDGAWNFLTGLYAEDIEDTDGFDDFGKYYWFGTQSNIFNPGSSFVGGVHHVFKRKQKAAFGEASWEFLPDVTLTGGVRAYDYDRDDHTVGLGGISGTAVLDRDIDASGTSLRGNLSYKPIENALIYANWAQGFRLGRPQVRLQPGECDLNNDGRLDGDPNITIDSTRQIESDEVESYELGGKVTLLDRRLTLAGDVYRMDWTQMPFPVVVPGTAAGCPGAVGNRVYTTNAGAARSEGVEFQANFYATEAFRIDLGGSYVYAKLTEDVPAQRLFAGYRLPSAPEVSANLGLQYEFALGGSRALVRADPIYVGSFYPRISSPDAPRPVGGYVKVDVSMRVAFRRTTLDLFVRNLTNEDDFTGLAGSLTNPYSGVRLRPRTVGLQLGYNFGSP